jgi:hypothetical protein
MLDTVLGAIPDTNANRGEVMDAERDTKNPLSCFDGGFLLRVLGLALVVVALSLVTRGIERGSPLRLTLGAAQALVMAITVAYTVARIRILDELKLRIQLEAIAIAFAATGALAAGYGMLERAGLPPFEWSQWGWPVMVLLWAVGLVIAGRRYR